VGEKYKCNVGLQLTKQQRFVLERIGFKDETSVIRAFNHAPSENGRVCLTLNRKMEFTIPFDEIFKHFYVPRQGFESEKPEEPNNLSQPLRRMIRDDANRFFWLAAMVIWPWDSVLQIYSTPPPAAVRYKARMEKLKGSRIASSGTVKMLLKRTGEEVGAEKMQKRAEKGRVMKKCGRVARHRIKVQDRPSVILNVECVRRITKPKLILLWGYMKSHHWRVCSHHVLRLCGTPQGPDLDWWDWG
jgi:hypothetical protein